MRTYYLDIGSRTNIQAKAENIDNLRKNLIRDYDAEMKRDYAIRVKVLVGPKYGSHYEEVGSIHFYQKESWSYGSAPTGYYWQYKRNGSILTARVSPKTGALLDVDRYWRRLFRWQTS